MATQPIFGIIPTGLPALINPTTAPSPTSFLYTLPPRTYSHIVVFILPGITLPPNTAAAVYLSTTPQDASTFRFLGGIGPGKESAIFKVSGITSGAGAGIGAGGEVDMDAPELNSNLSSSLNSASAPEITLGVSVESAESVSAQMASLPQHNISSSSNCTDLVIAPRSGAPSASKADTVQLAQKIIKNAFNFLASFSGNVPVPSGSGSSVAGVEVVPLKAFEDWWRKFEGKIRNDPGFLERGDGD